MRTPPRATQGQTKRFSWKKEVVTSWTIPVIDDKKRGPLPQGNSETLTSDNPLYFAVEDLTEIQEPVGNAPNQSEPVYNEVDENSAIEADRASWYGSVPVGDTF